jgi:hypothetical protein
MRWLMAWKCTIGMRKNRCIASTPEPEGGARCVSSARRDPCVGRRAIFVPCTLATAYSGNRQLSGWILPPQVIRALGAHCQDATPAQAAARWRCRTSQ